MKKSIKAQAIKTTPWFTEGESVEIRFNVYDKPTRIWGKTHIATHITSGSEFPVEQNSEEFNRFSENPNYRIRTNPNEPVIAETGSLDHSTDYWIVFSDGRELSFNSVFGHLPLSNFFKKVA